MTLFDVFLVIAIISLVVWLLFLIFLVVSIYKTYQHVKLLERTLHFKIDAIQGQMASRGNMMSKAAPFVATAGPLILSLIKRFQNRR